MVITAHWKNYKKETDILNVMMSALGTRQQRNWLKSCFLVKGSFFPGQNDVPTLESYAYKKQSCIPNERGDVVELEGDLGHISQTCV